MTTERQQLCARVSVCEAGLPRILPMEVQRAINRQAHALAKLCEEEIRIELEKQAGELLRAHWPVEVVFSTLADTAFEVWPSAVS